LISCEIYTYYDDPCSSDIAYRFSVQADINKFVDLMVSLERTSVSLSSSTASSAMSLEDQQRLQNRQLLWQVLQLLCAHEHRLGHQKLSANSASNLNNHENSLDTALIQLLLRDQNASSASSTSTAFSPLKSSSSPSSSSYQDESALLEVQRRLMCGQRDDAIKLAADNNLWPYAILLSAHLQVCHLLSENLYYMLDA
jgi:hypothetical protein